MFGPDVEVNAALDSRFHSGPTRYVLLSSTLPIVGVSGYSGVTEPVGYARVSVSPGSWSSAVGRATEVTVDLPDSAADLGVFPYWGLASASSGGTILWAGEFDEPLVLEDGTNNISVTLRVESPASFTD
jgi:hypothetical protein